MPHDGEVPGFARARRALQGLQAYAKQVRPNNPLGYLEDEDELCEIASEFLTDVMFFVGEIRGGRCLMTGLRNYYVERYEGGSNA